jgi:ribonucleoside-diphosphate reductase alpha chain
MSEEVYEQNYQYGSDDTVDDTWQRNAKALASIEDEQDVWEKKFYQLLSGKGLGTGPFPFTPGGRILANAGTGLGKASLINCYVSGFRGYDQDSMDEIQEELTRQAKILASEGGYGFCASVMRPRGGRIGGVGAMTPGAVQMLDTWNTQAATIVAGSGMKSDRDDVKDKIRKGAQMVTMHVWHPDIIEFIEAKQEAGRLHKFNMSVLITDRFMNAVRNDEKWALRFPAFEEEPEFYRENWNGDIHEYEAAGGTVKTWRDPATGEKAVYDARDIWDKIMRSTYERNEPGVLFIDTINKENNLAYTEKIDATNPCGEQVLPIGGVCLLGNLNLTQLTDLDAERFDYDLLKTMVPRAVRFLDNVNDLTYVPTEKQQENLQQKRRIGLGHYGDGSALMMMKVRYGSEEAHRRMRQFQERLANLAYQASAQLAKEKEPFPAFDRDYYLNEAPVVQRLSKKTREMIAAHGLRNSHLLSIQPTGNTSTLANAPSSGIEPVFMHSYVRTAEQPALPDGIHPASIAPGDDLAEGEVIEAVSGDPSDTSEDDVTRWEVEAQGDEMVLRCQEEGYQHWQIHPTRGVVKDETIEDYAVRRLKERGEWDPDAHWAVTTRDLEVDDHLTAMKALAPFVDSAMSKTVNVPNDYPFEDFQNLYEKAHQTGVIKGLTTYRAGTMSAVLSGSDDEDGGDDLSHTDAPERPDELDCRIYRVRYSGDRWKVFVGLMDGKPYEIFARPPHKTFPRLTNSSGEAIHVGKIRKVGSGQYQLVAPDGKIVIEDIAEDTTRDEVKEQTRLISTALRHGTPPRYIVKQLEKAEGSIASFGRAVAKVLKQEVPDMEVTCDNCGSANTRQVEGCMECADCGHSKCS